MKTLINGKIPLDYFKDNISWEDLRPLGQCVLIADETGHHELALIAAEHLASMWSLIIKEKKRLDDELKHLSDMNDENE